MLQSIYDSINPVAFSLGPFAVRWYGIAYVLGFICGGAILWKISQRWKTPLTIDGLYTCMLGIILGVVLGGRLGYVLFYGAGYYLSHPLEILAFSNGGMSFHGGLIGVCIAGVICSRITRVPLLTLLDLGVVAAPVGLFFGRVANFINGELWGAPSSLPWAVVFGGDAGMIARHPSQLYEALLEGVVLGIVLILLARKKPELPRGSYLGVFLVGYGIARFLIEFVRLPDVQLGYLWGGWLTMGQVLSVPLIIVGIGMLIWSQYAKLSHTDFTDDTEHVS